MRYLTERIAADGIAASSVQIARPAEVSADDQSTWYAVTLRYQGREMSIEYGMGPALDGAPEVADVMDTLTLNAASYVNSIGFEDWCGDFGIAPDEEASRTYAAIGEDTRRLREFLGADAFDAYLFDTESDV